MITDRPIFQRDITVKSEGGSAGPASASAKDLPPLPRCKWHPREDLKLFCKLCSVSMCSTCKETEHSQCQRRWDEALTEKGSPGSIFCEGVEMAAARLKDEVLGGLCAESVAKEAAVREAAELVLKRKEEVSKQLLAHKEALKTTREGLIKAVNERFDKLEALLEAAAVEKQEALTEQNKGLEAATLGLKQAKEGAEETLGSLVVEERPVEIVEACLRLKQELLAIYKASQASAPVREANLHVAMETLESVVEEVKEKGWAGALDVDLSQCTFNKHGDELFVESGGSFDIILTTRDKLGRQLKAGGVDMKVTVEPEARVDETVVVRDMDDGTYSIGFKAKKFEGPEPEGPMAHFKLSVQLCGSLVKGCALFVSRFPSLILITPEHVERVHGLLPGKRLELCYRASRDGWTASDFHRLCDNKGPTLVVAKEQARGNVFGGYAGVAWTSHQHWVYDPLAFLFTFTPGALEPVKLLPINTQNNLYIGGGYGPLFGRGNDLKIVSDSNTVNSSSSRLGISYHSPSGADSTTYLAGSHNFLLSELEVFLVK